MCLLLVADVLPVARLYILAGGKKKERVEGGKNGYEGEEGGGIGGGEEEKSPPLYCSVHSAQYSLSFSLSLSLLSFLVHTHKFGGAISPPSISRRRKRKGKKGGRKEGGRMGFRMLGSERGRWDEKRRRGKCDTG